MIIGYVRSSRHHMQHEVDDVDSLKALSLQCSLLLSPGCCFSVPVLFVTLLTPDMLVSAGVHYDSATEQYQVGVTARKNFQLGSSATWLKLSQDALYNPQIQKVHSQSCWHNMSGI
jgi:hypothetical protein